MNLHVSKVANLCVISIKGLFHKILSVFYFFKFYLYLLWGSGGGAYNLGVGTGGGGDIQLRCWHRRGGGAYN